MSSKRTYESETCLNQPFKTSRTAFSEVDPFDMMNDAARNLAARHANTTPMEDGSASSDDGAWTPCAHCTAAAPSDDLHQCERCQSVFCTTCSRTDYDARYERWFCLDCHDDLLRDRRGPCKGGIMGRDAATAPVAMHPNGTPVIQTPHAYLQQQQTSPSATFPGYQMSCSPTTSPTAAAAAAAAAGSGGSHSHMLQHPSYYYPAPGHMVTPTGFGGRGGVYGGQPPMLAASFPPHAPPFAASYSPRASGGAPMQQQQGGYWGHAQ